MNNRIKKSFVRQQGHSDCGVACLASIIKYHYGSVPLETLRMQSGTTSVGTTLLGLLEAARQNGMEAVGMEAESVENLIALKNPAILHVVLKNGLHHFIVFYGFIKQRVVIGDPGKGVETISKDGLVKMWSTRRLIQLHPGLAFKKKDGPDEAMWSMIRRLLAADANLLVIALFLGMLTAALGLSTAVFFQNLVDAILPSKNEQSLLLSLASLVLLLAARSSLLLLRGHFLVLYGKKFNTRIVEEFYDSILRLPKRFFDSRKTGDLIARINDTRRIQTTISIVAGNVIIDVLIIVVSATFVFKYSTISGLFLLFTIPLYYLTLSLLNSKVLANQKEAMAGYGLTEAHFIDTIQGISTIKANNKLGVFSAMNKAAYDSFQNSVFKFGKLSVQLSFVSDLIGVISLTGLFAICSFAILSDELKLGELVAVISLAGTIIPGVTRLVLSTLQVQEARVAFERMIEFTSVEAERDCNNSSVKRERCQSLELKYLCFRFPGRKHVLKDFSLMIRPGQITILKGKNGSGKSTLIQILLRFYTVESGSILYNSIPFEKIPLPIWRQTVAVVPQDVKLFNHTLLFNLTLSTRQEDWNAVLLFCKAKGFDRYFNTFPQGYFTLLGEGGISISGGQRQLVGLARALYREPDVLLLDEITSSLDHEAEEFVLKLLEAEKQRAAILLITHDLPDSLKNTVINSLGQSDAEVATISNNQQ
jgi:ATP-binding cassette subfamily B protein